MDAPVSEGEVVLGKYRVERVLGKGGMGVVVAATNIDLDQKVALKFLLPSALEHAEIVERFAREARAAAKIQSQHVARVLDTGKMPSGAPFMVMEYLEGEDLGQLLTRSGPLAPSVVADYLLQACEAIGEAHAAGIVHRDLKPANLFLAKQRDRRSIIKVLDFGISKLADAKAAPLTRTTTAMGSPHYMSPEQLISSKTVDLRTDIWSLGVIMYELIAGKRPFEGDTMPEVVGQVLNNEPARVGTLRADVSLDLELVIARCLTTSVKDRFQSVAELARALLPFATDAASASASVERTARILGGASLPPPAAAAPAAGGGVDVTMHSVDARAKAAKAAEASADEEGGATVRPPPAPAPSAPSAPSAQASLAASSPSPSPKVESQRELALASTSPSTDLSGALPATQLSVSRPPSRRGLFVIGGVVVCVAVVAGVRLGTSRPGAEASAERPPEPARSLAPSSASPPAPVASAAASVAVAEEPSAGASASGSAVASASASAAVRVPAPRGATPAPVATSTTKPASRASGATQPSTPTAAAPAQTGAPRKSLDMDLK